MATVLALSSSGVFAQDPIVHAPLVCIAPDRNPRITARIADDVRSARVMFRAAGVTSPDTTLGRDYYVEFHRGTGDMQWAMLPQIAPTTPGVEYWIVSTDSKGHQTSTQHWVAPAVSGCPTPLLGTEEQTAANNLVIGLTQASQSPVPVGFSCKGVVAYITAAGDLKPNEACRRELLAGGTAAAATATTSTATAVGLTAASKALIALGAAAVGTTTVVVYKNTHKDKVSPSGP